MNGKSESIFPKTNFKQGVVITAPFLIGVGEAKKVDKHYHEIKCL